MTAAPDSATPIEREERWALRAIAATGLSDPIELGNELLAMLHDMRRHGLDTNQLRDHQAVRLVCAALAECAGLEFHWPRVAQSTCEQAAAVARTERTLIRLAQPDA